ncbi:uncharacterized protein LOC110707037 isoform X2 [Chenopodium quinoa]|uniref:uncharacterized protein LOC110707037 isoform X2 n=1 Tax=Chenopodium quinoa TaxID=63459 RepID=UPI000B783389|nr:uncharacterized protein LOC110707037 isoform X2 [Chenopodium quinoa]
MDEIRKAVTEDRFPNSGDFGKLGTLDVAYGEMHPSEARDTNGPEGLKKVLCSGSASVCYKRKGARKSTSKKWSNMRNAASFNTDDCKGEKASARSINSDEFNGEKAMKYAGVENMVVMNTYDVSTFKMDMLKRWISADVVSMLQSVTSRVLRWIHAMDYCSGTGPLISSLAGEVVLFSGGIGAESMSTVSIAGFLRTQCCAYLAIVSE